MKSNAIGYCHLKLKRVSYKLALEKKCPKCRWWEKYPDHPVWKNKRAVRKLWLSRGKKCKDG
jgi:phage FluMu protein Com